MEVYKLIISDLVESDKLNEYDNYNIHSMEDFDDLEEIQALSEKAKFAKDFDMNKIWIRLKDNIIHSIDDKELQEIINQDKDKLLEIYDILTKDNQVNNSVEVRTEILKQNLIEVKEIEDLEERELIYQDVNLESIAEILTEVNLVDLKNQLGYYGDWQIIKLEDMHYLLAN